MHTAWWTRASASLVTMINLDSCTGQAEEIALEQAALMSVHKEMSEADEANLLDEEGNAAAICVRRFD